MNSLRLAEHIANFCECIPEAKVSLHDDDPVHIHIAFPSKAFTISVFPQLTPQKETIK